jgi:hypothetical protein
MKFPGITLQRVTYVPGRTRFTSPLSSRQAPIPGERSVASSSRSQVTVRTTSVVAGVACDGPCVDVRWRPPLAMAVVTRLVTQAGGVHGSGVRSRRCAQLRGSGADLSSRSTSGPRSTGLLDANYWRDAAHGQTMQPGVRGCLLRVALARAGSCMRRPNCNPDCNPALASRVT